MIANIDEKENDSIEYQKVQVKTVVLNKFHKFKKTQNANTVSSQEDNTSEKSVTNDIIAADIPYLKRLADKIQSNVIYPINAKRKKQTGIVSISFEVNKNGKIQNIILSKLSEFSSLNTAAINAVKKTNDEISEIPPIEIFENDKLSLKQMVEFK